MSSEKTKRDEDSASMVKQIRDILIASEAFESRHHETLNQLADQTEHTEIERSQLAGSVLFRRLHGVKPTGGEITRLGFHPPSPPPATLHYQTDAGKLFGKPPYDIKVDLRTSYQIKRGEDIKLPQFDPNFFSSKHIQCRFLHCPKTKVRSPANHDPSQLNKEDLYLCPNHQQEMTNLVTKQCAEKGIDVNYKDFKSKDFDDYTSLIGWMEKVYQHFEKKAPPAFFPSKTDLLLAEIFLNVRNFLIITNILLNPDVENLLIVLTPIFSIVKSMLGQCGDDKFVRNVACLLRQVMETILSFFGVVYFSVLFPLLGNPGAQIGAGIGGILGLGGAAVVLGAAALPIAVGVGAGLLCGGLVGGGIFNLYNMRHGTPNIQYIFTGETDGRFSVRIKKSYLYKSIECQ